MDIKNMITVQPEKLFSLVELRTKTLQSMLRIQIKTNIDKDRAYSALLLSSTRICLILDFLLKIVGDTIFYNFLNFQLLKYQNLCFPTLSNRNQHQTDSNSVLHLQIPKNILSISSSREKKFSCHWVYQRYFTCLYLPWYFIIF